MNSGNTPHTDKNSNCSVTKGMVDAANMLAEAYAKLNDLKSCHEPARLHQFINCEDAAEKALKTLITITYNANPELDPTKTNNHIEKQNRKMKTSFILNRVISERTTSTDYDKLPILTADLYFQEKDRIERN